MKLKVWLWTFALWSVLPAGAASVIPGERAAEMLRERPNTPIVDARSVVARSMSPIRGALAIDDSVVLEAGTTALLVGNDERQAMEAAARVETAHPGVKVLVVEGGDQSLRGVVGGVSVRTGNSGLPTNFIIPSDTCQTGPALHVFGQDVTKQDDAGQGVVKP